MTTGQSRPSAATPAVSSLMREALLQPRTVEWVATHPRRCGREAAGSVTAQETTANYFVMAARQRELHPRGATARFRSSPCRPYPLMGWSGRAPAPPAISWAGAPRQGARQLRTLNAAIAVVGIDIGKNSFHIVGHDERGAIVLRQKWSRGQVEARFANIRYQAPHAQAERIVLSRAIALNAVA